MRGSSHVVFVYDSFYNTGRAYCLVLTLSAIPHSNAVSTLMPPLVRR